MAEIVVEQQHGPVNYGKPKQLHKANTKTSPSQAPLKLNISVVIHILQAVTSQQTRLHLLKLISQNALSFVEKSQCLG